MAGLLTLAAPLRADPVPASERVERMEPTPPQLRGVDVQEHLGNRLPTTLAFRDQLGRPTLLGDVFDGKHPVLLTLNYSNCPMLCSLQLTGLVKGLKEVEWGINHDYRIVTVSLDSEESQETTQRTASRYLTQYGRPGAEPGWTFLTGSKNNIRAYADAIGFSFRYDDAREEFAHPAAVVLAAPDGTITRYLYGIEYDPKTLRLALVESSQGKIGTTLDRLILYCFHYDATEGRYAPVARRVMQVAGVFSVAVLGAFLTFLILADKKRKRQLAESTAS